MWKPLPLHADAIGIEGEGEGEERGGGDIKREEKSQENVKETGIIQK